MNNKRFNSSGYKILTIKIYYLQVGNEPHFLSGRMQALYIYLYLYLYYASAYHFIMHVGL